MSKLTILALVVCLYVPFSCADENIIDSIKDLHPFELKSSGTCPVPVVGKPCPDSNPFYYFKCCGDLASQCCFRLQDWVVTLLIILAILTIISIIVNFIRCICCSN